MKITRKYNFFGVVLFILLIAFFLSRANYTRKHSDDKITSLGKVSIKAIQDEEIKKIIKEVEKASETYVKKPQSSMEKIYLDFESGVLDAEKYVLYSLTALYKDPSTLPKEYQGAKDSSKDHAFLYGLINYSWDEFSEETKEKIRPFIISPYDPKSHFYIKSDKSTSDKTLNILDSIYGLKRAYANDFEIIDIPTIQVTSDITVTYAGDDNKQSAEWVAQGIRDALPKFIDLYGFKNKTTDALIVGEELNADGEASIDEVIKDMCRIKVRKQGSENAVKTTAAHELFHCFQFWNGLEYVKPDTKWLMEATAVWSEDYVYKDYATEHYYDKEYFPTTNLDMMSIKGNREYGLYLWYYFLDQKGGPYEIMEAVNFGKSDGIRQGTQSRQNFPREHREFAMWNWNRNPFKQYIDLPVFPEVSPYWGSIMVKNIEDFGELSYPINLKRGGVLYNFFTFDNEEIKLIEFFPTTFSGDDTNSTSGIQVFYKVNGNWNHEDWTGMEKRNFCREFDDENIEFVVIVTSNANLNNELDRSLKIKTTEKCTPGWKGSIKVEWENNNSMDIGFSKGDYKERGSYTLYETLEHDVQEDSLVVVDQKYFADYKELKYVEGVDKSCGTLWSKNDKRIFGSGFVNYKKAGNMPERAVSTQYSDDIDEFGGEYNLYFKIFGVKDGDKFQGIDISTQLNQSCFGIIPQAEGLSKNTYEYKTDDFYYEPNEVKIFIDSKDSTFSGEDRFEIYDGVFGSVKWNFRKIE